MLLETFSDKFEYKKLSQEEQEARGILGRLVGIIADTKNPTRNGRAYSEKLWNNVFNDPIMKEKIANRCVFGELGHPTDRTETDIEKVAICLAEPPKKGTDGKLYGVFDILNTKCGQLLKTLCDYGCNIGVSSRGEGDLVTDYQGNESVDPDTYSCECWDAVLIPAVKEARMQYVTESLDKKRYNKTLRESLQKTLESATEEERKVMQETLDNLHLNLSEEKLDEYTTYEYGEDEYPLDYDNGTYDPHTNTFEDGKSLDELKEELLKEMPELHTQIVAHVGKPPEANSGRPFRNIYAAFKTVVESKHPEWSIWYKRFVGNDYTGAQEIFRAITDIIQLPGSHKYPVYIDGVNNEAWFKYGDMSEIKDAIDNGKVVLCFMKAKTVAPDFMSRTVESLVEGNDQMTDDEILNEIAGTLEIKDVEAFKNDVKSGNGKKYAAEVETKCCDNCKARFKQMIDIKDESLNINEEVKDLVVDSNETIMEELQKSIKANAELEQKIVELQERLSVCYAKESKSNEDIAKYKDTIRKLAESSKQAQALQVKTSALEEKLDVANKHEEELKEKLNAVNTKLKENTENAISLKESIYNKTNDTKKLGEALNKITKSLEETKAESEKFKEALTKTSEENAKLLENNKKLSTNNSKLTEDLKAKAATFESEKSALNESIAQLQKDINLQKAEFNQKLDNSKKIVEKYKRATATAVDKYIELQANRLGSSVNEIKNRLPESYTFNDIDKICEDLQEYNLNMSRLPINNLVKKSMNENIKIKGTPSKNESILPANGFDDDIDEDLMYLAGN